MTGAWRIFVAVGFGLLVACASGCREPEETPGPPDKRERHESPVTFSTDFHVITGETPLRGTRVLAFEKKDSADPRRQEIAEAILALMVTGAEGLELTAVYASKDNSDEELFVFENPNAFDGSRIVFVYNTKSREIICAYSERKG